MGIFSTNNSLSLLQCSGQLHHALKETKHHTHLSRDRLDLLRYTVLLIYLSYTFHFKNIAQTDQYITKLCIFNSYKCYIDLRTQNKGC